MMMIYLDVPSLLIHTIFKRTDQSGSAMTEGTTEDTANLYCGSDHNHFDAKVLAKLGPSQRSWTRLGCLRWGWPREGSRPKLDGLRFRKGSQK